MADVTTIQNNAYQNAIDAMNNAITYTENASQAVQSLEAYVDAAIPTPPFVSGAQDAYRLEAIAGANYPVAPTLTSFDGINAPARPAGSTFSVPSISNIPAFNVVEPIITLPTAPSSTLPAAPGAAPEFNAPALPNKPTIVLPTAPTFAPVAIPEADAISIPVFDAVADFGDIVAPTERFEFSEAEYQSVLLDEVKSKLLYDLQNGGYGIDDADERRLWDRARERELLSAQTRLDELARLHAARGFDLPPGVLHAQQQAAQQEALEKNSTLSRDIAYKRADLYVENRKFTIEAARQVEDMLIRHAGTVAERALNASRAMVELGVAIFNAQVAKYNAKLDAYRTYAAAYESRVRAALTGVEIFKAKVEGARLTVETQKLYADVYQTQLEGVSTAIAIYETEMRATQVAASIEQLKLEGFRTQVSAYGEQVRARVAEFEMFDAQIKGELSKVAIYEASVQAYTARLSGIEVESRVADSKARIEIAQSQEKLDVYRSDIEAYKTQIGVVSEKIKSQLDLHRNQIAASASYMESIRAASATRLGSDEANARIHVANTSLVLEQVKSRVALLNQSIGIAGGIQNANASTMATIGGAWASSVTGLTAAIS